MDTHQLIKVRCFFCGHCTETKDMWEDCSNCKGSRSLVPVGGAPMKAYDTGIDTVRKTTSTDIFNTQVGGDHYLKMKMQPIELVLANDMGFVEGSVIKYVCRWKFKGGVQDLKKARNFLDQLIAFEESKKTEDGSA